jgi:hypothetical protein
MSKRGQVGLTPEDGENIEALLTVRCQVIQEGRPFDDGLCAVTWKISGVLPFTLLLVLWVLLMARTVVTMEYWASIVVGFCPLVKSV